MVRHKNRYIVVEINPQEQTNSVLKISSGSIHTAVLQKLQQMHGDFGVAASKAGYSSKYCNENTRIAIIKVRHGPHKLVASCLPCINTIDNKRINLNTLYTGATMRQCFKFIIDYSQKKVEEMCASLKNDEDKHAVKEALLNFDAITEMY